MKTLLALLTAVVLVFGVLVATPAVAQAATCTVHLGGTCGAYSTGTTWTNGFNSYVTDQDVGCGADASVCNDTLTANSFGNWSLRTTMKAPSAFCSQVRTYPDMQQLTNEPSGDPITFSNYKALYSSFNLSNPAGGSYEAAYDIWIPNGNNGLQEVMIWTSTHNHDHGEVLSGTPVIYGEQFHVYTSGNKNDPGEIVVKLDRNAAIGNVHIRTTLNWLRNNGWLPDNFQISQINYGWEICGTGSQPKTFTVNSYSLTGVK